MTCQGIAVSVDHDSVASFVQCLAIVLAAVAGAAGRPKRRESSMVYLAGRYEPSVERLVRIAQDDRREWSLESRP